MSETLSHKDFFISYSSADLPWAEWIAFELEHAGFTTVLQAWDFHPGSNFISEMDMATKTAERTIAVLSPAYFTSNYTFAEWASAFRRDPRSQQGLLLPVRVKPCDVEGLLGAIIYIDLVDQNQQTARDRLLQGVRSERLKPSTVVFPAVQDSPFESPTFPGTLPPVWNIPHSRNPYFTGREKLLTQLATQLQVSGAAALSQPWAISGLGGIGKTQVAVEYAYQHRHDYQAVLWVQADTQEALITGFVALAKLLNLPETEERDQGIIVNAVKTWLGNHKHWLLILDNADELSLAREFIPLNYAGHLLLTTRAQAMGRLALKIEVEEMDIQTGALLLLRRAGLLAAYAPFEQASAADRASSKELSLELGGLPLALDQAGAYIEETQCSLTEYRDLYRTRRAELLKERGGVVLDHPEPVATTWSLSFAKVEQTNPEAADLLRLCSFLHPEAIPEEVLSQGVSHHGTEFTPLADDPLAFNRAVAALLAYSLVRRDTSTHTLNVHRLVQATLVDTMDMPTAEQWAIHTVQIVSETLSQTRMVQSQWERYLAHAQRCVELIEQWNITSLEAAQLLSQVGSYLEERARYIEAEPLCRRALTISEQELGPDHLSLGPTLNILASIYRRQGKHAQAESMAQRAFTIYEQPLSHDQPPISGSLHDLAWLYHKQGEYIQAEPLYQQTLAITEEMYGVDHIQVTYVLNNLARLYLDQRRYAEAESLYQRALTIYEQELGPEHLRTADCLHALARLHDQIGKYADAETLFKRALTIYDQRLGPDHPTVAWCLSYLASLYREQGMYTQADLISERAIGIYEHQLKSGQSYTAIDLHDLAWLYHKQGKYDQAEPIYKRALAASEQQLGPEHSNTTCCLYNLAMLYTEQNKYDEVELLYKRILGVKGQKPGFQHSYTIKVLEDYATLLRKMGRESEAIQLEGRMSDLDSGKI